VVGPSAGSAAMIGRPVHADDRHASCAPHGTAPGRSASVMAVSPIGLRGMVSTPKRYVTIRGAGEDASIAVLEAPTVVAGLDDVAMMRQAIQHGGGHPGVAEYLRPIGKSQIGGDQQRRVFVQLADQVEQ